MGDKVKDMEERLDKLENRLKVTFLEIEKRFESLKEEQPISVEDRLQELEDLLLLIQLEVTKMREKSNPLDFSIGTTAPDIKERLDKLEEAVINGRPTMYSGQTDRKAEMEMDKRMREMEEKVSKHKGHEGKGDLTEKMDEIDRRLRNLEGRKHMEATVETSGAILDDVRKILHHKN